MTACALDRRALPADEEGVAAKISRVAPFEALFTSNNLGMAVAKQGHLLTEMESQQFPWPAGYAKLRGIMRRACGFAGR